jgi:hypothetical protein
MLGGNWQAGLDLLWPFQPKPPKPFCATFHWCLRQTFCRGQCPNQPTSYSMQLDKSLGRWLSVLRTTWHAAYRSSSHLFWHRLNDETLQVLAPSKTSGFFHLKGTTTTVPLNSHPIEFQQVGEALWTQHPHCPAPLADTTLHPPGHLVENTLCHPTNETITIGSDGSVHLTHQVAACAWMIHNTDEEYATACFLLSNISSMSSYCSKLEGILQPTPH